MNIDIEKIIDGLGEKASKSSKAAAVSALRDISDANVILAQQVADANAATELNAMAIIGYRTQIQQISARAQKVAAQTGGLSEQLSESRQKVTLLGDELDKVRAEIVALKEPAGEETP